MHFQLTVHLTPHSLRAGGATRMKTQGDHVTVIQEYGPWEHIKTARNYIDTVFTRLSVTLENEGRVPDLDATAFTDMIFDFF